MMIVVGCFVSTELLLDCYVFRFFPVPFRFVLFWLHDGLFGYVSVCGLFVGWCCLVVCSCQFACSDGLITDGRTVDCSSLGG